MRSSLVAVGSPAADVGFHFGRTRSVQSGNIAFFLGFCLYLRFFGLLFALTLKDNTVAYYLVDVITSELLHGASFINDGTDGHP